MTRNGKSGEKLPPVDMLLVSMPFCDEYMPCLTLSLFKSILREAGIFFSEEKNEEKQR